MAKVKVDCAQSERDAAAAPAKPKLNLFNKAKTTAAESTTTKKPSKGTSIVLPILMDTDSRTQVPENARLHEAIADLIKYTKIEKDAKGRQNTAKGLLQPPVIEELCKIWAKLGCQPDTPVSVRNISGEEVTLVMQNRAGQYAFTDDQLEALKGLVGEQVAMSLVKDEDEFSLDAATLAEEGVAEKLSDAIANAGLTEEQAGRLLKCDTVRKLKPTVMPNLFQYANGDPGKIEQLLDVLGSTAVTYFKA